MQRDRHEAPVAPEHDRAALVAAGHDLEGPVGAGGVRRQVAELVMTRTEGPVYVRILLDYLPSQVAACRWATRSTAAVKLGRGVISIEHVCRMSSMWEPFLLGQSI